MKSIKFFLAILISFFINSCSQFGDSLFLPGEDPEDIVLYELDNEYLAPESKEYISFVHSSKELNSSYILVGKKTYGFEANLNTNESLSFDEDGELRLERDHPFLADKYKKGDIKNGSKDRDKGDKDRDKDDKDWDREEKEKCFELVMPYTLIMPDASSITIETEEDRKKVEEWYKNNPDSKDRPSLEYPVDIVIETDEGERTITVDSDDEMKEIQGRCERGRKDKDRDGKDKCRKLHGDDIVDCILEYVNSNYPNEEIVHARRLKTKDGDVFYVVKLSDSIILKFNDSCELLD